jgi:hypothetical protein
MAGRGRSKQAGKSKKVEDDNRFGFFLFTAQNFKFFGLSLFFNDNKSGTRPGISNQAVKSKIEDSDCTYVLFLLPCLEWLIFICK